MLNPASKLVLDNESKFCLPVNNNPLGDFKSANILVNLETSSNVREGINVPPLRRKSIPPLLSRSDKESGGDDVM